MSSDVVLTAALRNNLLSLQNTQSLIDKTQLRLATGLKVNSALDNAQNFFAAQSLNNRASDLTRLLDGIGQSIQTVQAADDGVTALTSLIEQADSLATQAQDALASGSTEAKIVGDVDLSGVTDLTSLNGVDASDVITFTLDDEDGTSVSLSASTVTIAANDSIEQLITKINDITNSSDSSQALEASLDTDGHLQIKSLQGGNLRIAFTTGGIDLAQGLGLDTLTLGEISNNTAIDQYAVTVSGTATLTSHVFYEAGGSANGIADASTLLSALDNSSGTNYFAGQATDQITLSVDGGTTVNVGDITTLTIQGFVDAINGNTSLNTKISASYDDTTGQISIQAIDPTVKTVQVGVSDVATNGASANFGFGLAGAAAPTATGNKSTESIAFGVAASTLAQLEADFNGLRSQIDLLVADSGYRGVNLLNGDDLTTYFNEDRTSSLTTEGTTFTSSGLGISQASFRDAATIQATVDEVADALDSVRSFGSTLANDLAIIQTREDFTNNTINNLEEGADKLTVADQNEEGANLLALQTRQTLGVTSLSLASQSQQAVLRLF
ncbi:MAG: flagellin [Alphaproteobacteria bacterium]|nr:flagellin [Alphaproteobacteria bacterium]